MKHLSFTSIIALAKEVGLAFIGIVAALIEILMRMSLPRLLAVCLVTALIVMILPLAVTLFVVALILKIVAAAVVLASRQAKEQPKPRLENGGEQ